MNRVVITLWVGAAILIGCAVGTCFPADQEYALALASPDKPTVMIGIVAVGLNKVQAEGAAVQLNRTFEKQSIPVVVCARPRIDIGNYK
jgi:Zn-dependent alcohol dehydrogenase